MNSVAIIGNPNSGKTTFFNKVTGSSHHTGNWPGVTVDIQVGIVQMNTDIQLMDLPGLYSLNPETPEQQIAGNFIAEKKADLFLNIIDATNLERNLYLTLQLLETGAPLVIAINMVDEAVTQGFQIDVDRIAEELQVPVVAISSVTGFGLGHLIQTLALKLNDEKKNESRTRENLKWLPDVAYESNNNPFVIAFDTKIAPYRYAWLERFCSRVALRNDENLKKNSKIDQVLLHGVFGVPIFLFIIMVLFFLVFGPLGNSLSELAGATLALFQKTIGNGLMSLEISEWLIRLIVDGIMGGVGSVLIFVPQFTLLFIGLSLLENSGYMSRAAFVMDRFMRKFGLSGKAFIPMLVGFGCNVPAIMATRTLSSERERKLTVFLLPFMSCGARMPVYAVLTAAFFGKSAGFVVFGLYAAGILAAMFTGMLLQKTFLKGNSPPFIIELPPYRMPTIRNSWFHVKERVGDYIKKAGTLIFAASVIVWFLQAFTPSLLLAASPDDSLFADIGRFIAPVFTSAGLSDWRISVSLIAGFTAKEAIISTLGVLLGSSEDVTSLSMSLQSVLEAGSALSMMVFVLLYTPCMATVAAMQREFKSWKWTSGAIAWQLVLAWLSAVAVYQVSRIFT